MYELCLSGRMPEAQDLLQKEDTIKIKRFIKNNQNNWIYNPILFYLMFCFTDVYMLCKGMDYRLLQHIMLSMIGMIQC